MKIRRYINQLLDNKVYTLAEYDSHVKAMAAVIVYRLHNPKGEYYVSTRSTKQWREK